LAELEMVIINWFAQAMGLPRELYFEENARDSTGGGVLFVSLT
jgi:hypothetical protein